VIGLGYTYYIKSTVGSPYVEASIGLGDFYNIDASECFTVTEFLIGAGYEINSHIKVGANFQGSNTEYTDNAELELDYRTIAAKVEFKL